MDPDESALRRQLEATIIVFIALTIGGVGIALLAHNSVGAFAQQVLIALGAGIFGAGLTFFLIQMFAWDRQRHPSPSMARRPAPTERPRA
jgi:hypothetical protein